MSERKLKLCLREWVEQEEQKLNEELKNMEPHVFSERYRNQIEEAIKKAMDTDKHAQ